jgi:hypothetical protein
MKENNVHRSICILLAIGILISLAVFAEYAGPQRELEIWAEREAVFRNKKGYIYSNGTVIQSVSDRSFTTKWQKNTFREFVLSTKVPFSTEDSVAFQIRFDNGIGHLEEFHIWKPVPLLYIKAFISLLPLGVVVLLFFRDYRFDSYRWMFVRKVRQAPHA